MASLKRNKTLFGHTRRLSKGDGTAQVDVRDVHIPALAAFSKVTQNLDNFDDKILAAHSNPVLSMAQGVIINNSADIVSAAAKIVDFKALEENMRGFQEASQVLMKALDEITKIHPVIAVAVLALKGVISLELTRRSNDKKVIALHLQMEDTMSVLLQLRNVKDPEEVASDGTTLPSRLRGIMSQLAQHIRECGNACDAYMKKNLVVKILKSPIYEGRLADFAAVFADHRKELEFSLVVHTTVGVDAANQTLANLTKSMQAVTEKLDMIAVFRAVDTPLERTLQNYVTERGGVDACIADDEALKKLSALSRKKDGPMHPSFADPKKNPRPQAVVTTNEAKKPPENPLKALKDELMEDVDESLAKNMLVFERKLEVQQRQIVREVEDVVRRSGDLVIKTIISGPHDRIIDPDLRIIWKEMGWKGSVKARHFVLAIQDYFLEKSHDDPGSEVGLYFATPPATEPGEPTLNGSAGPLAVPQTPPITDDKWAVEYISVTRIQPLQEAFDEDGTGFISLREANVFTSARPKDWSLPKWLAYWAAGWHYSVWDYREKICAIIQRMFDLARWNVLDVNRKVVDGYLREEAFKDLELLLRSVDTYVSTSNTDISPRISSYLQEEESKLESNLDSIAYNIDAINTIKLITGTERAEQFIFRLLYLVLKRHLRVIHMACSIVLHEEEFSTATTSLTNIFDAVRQRISTISDIAKQQNKNVSAIMNVFGFGMFEWLNEPEPHQELIEDYDLYGLRDMETNDEIDTSLLKCGELEKFDASGYTEPEHPTGTGSSVSDMIAGSWNGHCVTFLDVAVDGLMEMTLHDGTEKDTFQGEVEDALGISSITGHANFDDPADIDIVFSKDPGGDIYEWKTWFFGKLDPVSRSISGEWGYNREHLRGTFLLTQTPAYVHRFRYTKAQFAENPALARWHFAVGAIQHQVKQQLWSWSYFKERLADRKRVVELATYRNLFGMWFAPEEPFTEDYYVELDAIEKHLSRGDRRLYKSITQMEVRNKCVHPETCDSCGWSIGGARIFCLTCMEGTLCNQIDLCINCIDKTPSRDALVHTEDHPLIKVSRILHDQQKAYIVNNARDALARVHELFPKETQVCGCCEEEVTTPFWFCSSCVAENDDLVAYCDDCCITYQYTLTHEVGHPSLVRWKPAPEKEESEDEGDKTTEALKGLDERLEALEQRFEDQKAALEANTERINALETKMDEGFTKMEELIQLIVSKGSRRSH